MVEYFKFQVGSCGVKSWDGCLCDIMWASLDVSIKLGSKIESNSFILATILKMGGSAQGVSLGCIFYRKRERQNLTYILRSSFFFCLKIVVTLGTTIQNTPSKNPINTQFHKRYWIEVARPLNNTTILLGTWRVLLNFFVWLWQHQEHNIHVKSN